VPIGQTPTIAVTVSDISNSTVQLNFVGLRFEWNGPSTFFVGGNSDKGAVLTPGQTISYAIAVTVPGDVTPGIHRLSGYATYRVLSQGNWSSVRAGWWVADLAFAYPQTLQSPPQGQSSTGPTQQSFSTETETVGVIVVIVAIGLFLERGRVRRVIRRPKAPTKAEPVETAKPESQEPEPRREEEDL
jgi:hypothetical protein